MMKNLDIVRKQTHIKSLFNKLVSILFALAWYAQIVTSVTAIIFLHIINLVYFDIYHIFNIESKGSVALSLSSAGDQNSENKVKQKKTMEQKQTFTKLLYFL